MSEKIHRALGPELVADDCAVWGEDAGLDRTFNTHIKTLRAKLLAAQNSHTLHTLHASTTASSKPNQAAPRDFIITQRGMGYALVLRACT